MFLPFKAAVFDMDGTIIDSLGIWEKIDYDFLEKKRGIKVPEDYVFKIAPMSFTETAIYTKERFSLPETPEELMQEWTDMAIYEYSNNISLKDGALEYIKKLKAEGKKVVLCTSSPNYLYEPVLKKNNIYDMFDAFASTCEVGVGKTFPDVYLLAAKKSGVEPCDCLCFEDVIDAAACAKSVGMKVCGVFDERSRNHKEQMIELCDNYIDSFTELL